MLAAQRSLNTTRSFQFAQGFPMASNPLSFLPLVRLKPYRWFLSSATNVDYTIKMVDRSFEHGHKKIRRLHVPLRSVTELGNILGSLTCVSAHPLRLSSSLWQFQTRYKTAHYLPKDRFSASTRFSNRLDITILESTLLTTNKPPPFFELQLSFLRWNTICILPSSFKGQKK